MNTMFDELEEKLVTRHSERQVRALVVKLKFSGFRRTTAECANPEIDREIFISKRPTILAPLDYTYCNS